MGSGGQNNLAIDPIFDDPLKGPLENGVYT